VQQLRCSVAPLVGMVGAAFSMGQPRDGTEIGPVYLRKAGLVDVLESAGWEVHDTGNLQLKPGTKEVSKVHNANNSDLVGKAAELVFSACREHARAGRFALMLGGDHSMAMGSVSGSASVHKDLSVLWVDAHADINTPETSPTGNMHGMPVAFMSGITKTKCPALSWLKPWLKPDRIAYIGLRDVDAGERKILADLGIKAYGMSEVDQHGIQEVLRMACAAIDPGKNRPLHLSFDIDSLDPVYTPSTGTPVPGGLTLREGRYIVETLFKSKRMVSMDLVEVNPALGDERDKRATVSSALQIAAFAFGVTFV